MGGMTLDESVRVKMRFADTIIPDLISQAKIFKLPAQTITQKWLDLKEEQLPKRTPEWVRWYLSGVFETHRKYLEQGTEYGGYINGQYVSTYKDSPYYYEKHGFTPKQCCDELQRAGFCWKGDTHKPYFIPEEE